MKKKLIVWGVVILLLISLLPFPQKIERTFYGIDTIDGQKADISLDMTYLRFLFLKDKIYGTIDVKTEKETFTYGEYLHYIGQTLSVNNENDNAHDFSGWHWNDETYTRDYGNGALGTATVGFEPLLVHMSSDFDKILILHNPGQKIDAHNADEENESQEERRYVGCTDKNQLKEAEKYFIGYYDRKD